MFTYKNVKYNTASISCVERINDKQLLLYLLNTSIIANFDTSLECDDMLQNITASNLFIEKDNIYTRYDNLIDFYVNGNDVIMMFNVYNTRYSNKVVYTFDNEADANDFASMLETKYI